MNYTASQLWDHTRTVWQDGLFGVDIGRIVIALAILFGFMLLRGLFSRYVLAKLHKLSEKNSKSL